MGKETLRFSNAWHCWNFRFRLQYKTSAPAVAQVVGARTNSMAHSPTERPLILIVEDVVAIAIVLVLFLGAADTLDDH